MASEQVRVGAAAARVLELEEQLAAAAHARATAEEKAAELKQSNTSAQRRAAGRQGGLAKDANAQLAATEEALQAAEEVLFAWKVEDGGPSPSFNFFDRHGHFNGDGFAMTAWVTTRLSRSLRISSGGWGWGATGGHQRPPSSRCLRPRWALCFSTLCQTHAAAR